MNKMTDFELWIKACRENDTVVFKLPENGLYKTWNEHMVNNNTIRSPAVFHVWKDGKRIYCGQNYLEAVNMAERGVMHKTHDLKILPEYFAAVNSGAKNFEVRKNDRDFRLHDVLILREWDGENYTGRWLERSIGYILPGGEYGIEDGYCVLALKRGRPTVCLD